MLVYLPGAKGGRRISAYAQPTDLMPTICELLGVSIPEAVQAPSLLPLLRGARRPRRDFVVSSPTVSHPGIEVPHPTVRSSVYSGEWLLVYGAQVDRDMDQDTTRMVDSVLRRVQVLEKGPIRPRLYHLASDPGCRRNVLRKHREVAENLHGKYVGFLEKAGVPEQHLRFFRTL